MKKAVHNIRKELLAHCPVCGGGAFATEIESRDFESGTGRYCVQRCRQCGMRFTNPRPAKDAIEELYRTRESADYVRSHAITDRLRAAAIRSWFRKLTPFAGPGASVLDYGCGDGFFALQLSRCPAVGDVTAVDLHDRPPFYLEDRDDVRYGTIEQLRGDAKRYQMIFCRHVIEHIPDPAAALADLQVLLAPGGSLVVEVPNWRSVWRKLFGRYYFGLYLPRHLLHFDEPTLAHLFRKYRPIKLVRRHTPVIGKSLGYLFGMQIGNLGAIGLGLFPLQVLVDCMAGTSSVLSLVLRKQQDR